MTSLLGLLGGAAARVAVPAPIRELLDALQVVSSSPWPAGGPGAVAGEVTGHVDRAPLGLVHLDLSPGGPHVPFQLVPTGPGGGPGFTLDLLLSRVTPLSTAVGLADPGPVLRPARHASSGDGDPPTAEWLEPVAGAVTVVADLALRVAGSPTEPAALGLVPLTGPSPSDGIVDVRLEPGLVVFGDTGFGLDLSGGIVLDDSTTATPAPAPPPPGGAPDPAGTPGWRGFALRGARLFLPRGLPFVGGVAVPFDLECGRDGGLDATATIRLPAEGRRPQLDVQLAWHDPAATGLADLLPTLVQVTATVQIQGEQVDGGQGGITLGGGSPLTLRARYSRDLRAAPPSMAFDLAVDQAGDDGLIRVDSSSTAGKIFVTAAALATALVADSRLEQPSPSGDASGVWLHALLTAALGASAFFDPTGKVVVTAVRLHGDTSASGTSLRLSVDYLVDVLVTRFDVGVLDIGMNPAQPLRIRYRDVRVEVDPTVADLSAVHVSFAEAVVDVEDPGGWQVHSPGSVLDVLGTRSGRGSVWFEIDLRFSLDLGPITVSDATIRVTPDGGTLHPELRGLGISVQVGLLAGHGAARMTTDGFFAVLDAELGEPLGITARAWLTYKGGSTIALGIEGSLPGPVPLGPTLLGLYSIGGILGLNARPVLPATPADLVQRQLDWREDDPAAIAPDKGALMLGASAGLGTLYDAGFTFSAHGKLIVTLPEPSLRIAARAWLLHPRETDPNASSPFTGVLVVDGDGITLGLRGDIEIPELLKLTIPIGGRLPFTDPQNWYLDIGTDGHPDRPPGPVQARVLPRLLDAGGSAYLMLHGAGLPHLGNSDPDISLPGPAIGFGLEVRVTIGLRPILYVSIVARLRAGLATDPAFLAAVGRIDGSLHLGPFSIGAHADLQVRVGPGDDFWARFRVCGSIDLWLIELEGCVDIEIPPSGPHPLEVPEPDDWPFPQVALSDRHYVGLGTATGSPAGAPVVWPDVVPILQFPLGPAAGSVDTAFQITDRNNAGDGHTGNDQLSYTYTLEALHLKAETAPGVFSDVTGVLDAAWQQPKHVFGAAGSSTSPGAGTGARELALLTFQPGLWAARRTDGGAGHRADPVTPVATGCHDSAEPTPGWALGADAALTGDGAALAADPVRPGRYPSVFAADVVLTSYPDGSGTPLTEAALLALARPPVGVVPIRASPFDPPVAVPATDHGPFGGALRLPFLTVPRCAEGAPQTHCGEVALRNGVFEEFPEFHATITPSADLDDAQLWIAVTAGVDDRPVRVNDRTTAGEGPDDALPDGTPVHGFRVGACGPDDPITLSWPLTASVLVIGLRGVTREAATAAAAVATAAAQYVSVLHLKRQTAAAQRTPMVLRPDTRHQLVVTLRATGTVAGGVPRDFGTRTSTAWFATARAEAAPAVHPGPRPEMDPQLWTAAGHQATFWPTDLGRYLGSYTPADRTVGWYPTDALTANFDVDHVLTLARLYGYGIDLAVRRLDDPPHPPAAPPPSWTATGAVLGDLLDPGVLTPDLRRYAALDPTDCPLPPAGASLTATPRMAPRATYELAVAFPTPGGPVTAQTPLLRGIVFTTSRYTDPAAQLRELGFGVDTPGTVTGHLPIDRGAAAALPDGDVLVSDAALLTTLEQGVSWPGVPTDGPAPAWPPAEVGRSSALWCDIGGHAWRLLGMVLESPEPLSRPGRVDVVDLLVDGTRLPVRVRDRAGCRLLFLARTPLPPGPHTARLTRTERGAAAAAATCAVAAGPPFAVEPS